jgi:hypothetical protein
MIFDALTSPSLRAGGEAIQGQQTLRPATPGLLRALHALAMTEASGMYIITLTMG